DDKFITTDYLQQCPRYVIMKLSENYPYKGVYEKCLV
ncbi:TPA: hypothetical protein ACSXRV_005554, partial [Klebsiella pneumoniae]